MDDRLWIGLVYKGDDFSDKFEYNLSGEIRNIRTKRIMTQRGNHVLLNYEDITIRIHIPTLMGRVIKKPKRSAFTKAQREEILAMIDMKLQIIDIQ